jgi:quercetin dioxygenase-like cupin family protein
LHSGSTSWDGGAFSYPDGEPEISIQKITIQTDGEKIVLPVHCHPIPMAGYVLKGSVQVMLKSTGKSRVIKAGEALIEVSNTWHHGTITEDTELLVFYAGKKGMPNTLKEGDTSPLATGCK